ncbi:hypothetical protein L228DRAFT_236305 [Xylona heveae TC161]|uniref:Mediator of RNA polymerase II transcription subunit 4 n=1 Tax=Xylona heveae (strain CBS 132557 / TC161) TaxID=1328760 RepID=A0A165IPA8_XYLHT|nr:hypothetical protein L228DRAFT_236305 [Xylona heveae TC161]KZF25185.1 hypothetical protein L228DRAFT_236305 [Xylona heveae TC161]
MDTILEEDFQRVELTLNALIDSITSYNPSPSAAFDLLSADDELSKDLETLSTHQANHARILSLRNTSAALDTLIKNSLMLLADTRKELLSTPATKATPLSRDVSYAELLAYAKRISKFTVPPTGWLGFGGAPLGQPTEVANPEDQKQVDATEANAPALANGIAAPAAGTPAAANQPSGEEGQAKAQNLGIGVSSLEKSETQWLNPSAQVPFAPWPGEEVIRRGALAQIQVMLEQGNDPASVADPATEARIKEEEESKREKEKKDQEEKEDRRRKELQAAQEAARRESYTGAAAEAAMAKKPQQPTVFGGLDLYDPDAE